MWTTKKLERSKIDIYNPWRNEGLEVLIYSPSYRGVLAKIWEPYDSKHEGGLQTESGEVYYCERFDNKLWLDTDNRLTKRVAIHYMYMYKPLKGEWDKENNNA